MCNISFATHIVLEDGRVIWNCPSGKPYWITINGCIDLTEREIDYYFTRIEK